MEIIMADMEAMEITMVRAMDLMTTEIRKMIRFR